MGELHPLAGERVEQRRLETCAAAALDALSAQVVGQDQEAFVPISLKASPVEIELPNGGVFRTRELEYQRPKLEAHIHVRP